VRSGERWLDIGAGSGAVGLGLSQSGAEVVLSDRPEIAQSWDGQSLPANVEIQASDVLVDELKGQFDGVLLCRFIEICSPTQALMLFRKIRRILAKGGRLCLAGYFSPDCPLFPLFGVQVVLDTKTGRTYTHQELVHLAQQAGYDSVNAHVNRVGGYDIVIIPTAG
jgi:ubiquinone/menaquinone biosynthesis C-methylase UbiE